MLIVSRGATVGRIGVVEENVAFCLMGSVILCKPREQYDSAFLYFALNAKHCQTSLWFSLRSSGDTFPALQKKMLELTTQGKRFAVIADEAHNSQTGEAAKKRQGLCDQSLSCILR